MPIMKKEPVPLGGARQVVYDAIAKKGTDFKAVSQAIGRSHSFIHQYLTYAIPRVLKEEDRERLAVLLGIDEQRLRENGYVGRQVGLVTRTKDRDKVNRSKAEYERFASGLPDLGKKDIPIRGTAAGGTRGEFLMANEVVDYAFRPASLTDVKNVYGVLIRGDSLSPRWYPGEPAFVNPDKPAKAGDFVVVQIQGKDGEIEGLIKLLVRQDDKSLTLRQFTPARDFKVSMAEVIAVHRVYWPNEIWGI